MWSYKHEGYDYYAPDLSEEPHYYTVSVGLLRASPHGIEPYYCCNKIATIDETEKETAIHIVIAVNLLLLCYL